MKVQMVKKLNGLQPVDETGEFLMRKIKMGDIVTVDVRRSRNARFHRKLFAMLQIILQNQEHYRSIDELLEVCKLRIGHCKVIQTRHGEVRIPMSISFGAMDNAEFADFYNRACQWVITEVIPGLERHDLDQAVSEELREFAGNDAER